MGKRKLSENKKDNASEYLRRLCAGFDGQSCFYFVALRWQPNCMQSIELHFIQLIPMLLYALSICSQPLPGRIPRIECIAAMDRNVPCSRATRYVHLPLSLTFHTSN
jgi:hypothetical protein